MTPHDHSGRPIEQPPLGGQPAPPGGAAGRGAPPGGGQQTGRPRPIAETTVSAPTLRRVSIETGRDQVPIGPDDYVLDSVYNHQVDAWEVLVLVQPGDSGEEETDEE